MGDDGTRARYETIQARPQAFPSELHIKLVVHDDDALGGLRIAQERILTAAQHNADAASIEYFYRVYYCVRAVEAAYVRIQALSLDREVEAARALPDLCRDWCSLMDDSAEQGGPFPQLAALAEDDVFDQLLEQPGKQAYRSGGLCFLLVREDDDLNAEAGAQPERLVDRLKSLWRRVRRGAVWAPSVEGENVAVVRAPTC